jgi:DNA-binding beta-propeller fold protein YncE
VLFTDIVDSTAVAEELGDQRWKSLLDRHNRMVRGELKRFGGRELDTAGDGFFASFREPAPAISCACAATEVVRELGIEIRAGVHFGECERVGKKLTGITVVVGARIAALGDPGDVLVSSTAAELARGAGFGFEDRGTHILKGVEGESHVFGVSSADGHQRAPPAAANEAKARREAVVAGEARRRWWAPIVTAVAGLALLAVAGLAVLLTRGGELDIPGPDTVARIDPSRNAFDRVLAVGSHAYPQGIAFGAGKLWVVNVTTKTLLELDPASGEGRVLGMPSTPTGVAFEGGRVWLTFGFLSDERRVSLLDPEDPTVLEAAPFSVPDGSYPITAGAGSVWIADPLGSTVTRYDPVTEERASLPLQADSGPVDVRVSSGSHGPVWVAAGREPSVSLIDAAHPARPKSFGTGGDVPTALAVAPDGSAWVASEQSDSVLAITPAGMIRVHEVLGARCDGPTGIAATGNAVWVSCAKSRRVVRLDASDGSFVTELPVGGAPGAMTVDEDGALWVTVQGA